MTNQTLRIVFAEPYPEAAVARLRGLGDVTFLEKCNEKTLAEAVRTCDALLVRSSAQITRTMIEQAERLRVIGRAGVGLEHVDLEAARAKGIQVVYTPVAATDAVADLTVGMIIGVLRNIGGADRAIREGYFDEARETSIGRDLSEMVLGIIGFGRVGKAVARRCHLGFGMTILYNDIVEVGSLNFPAILMEKNELFRSADFISLHVPLTSATRHLISAETLSRFKMGSFLINTARGAIADNFAIAQALITGKLAGAALDVFDPEPLPASHPLLFAPNTILTPHIGARTVGGLGRMYSVVDDVAGVLRGEAPVYPAWS